MAGSLVGGDGELDPGAAEVDEGKESRSGVSSWQNHRNGRDALCAFHARSSLRSTAVKVALASRGAARP